MGVEGGRATMQERRKEAKGRGDGWNGRGEGAVGERGMAGVTSGKGGSLGWRWTRCVDSFGFPWRAGRRPTL